MEKKELEKELESLVLKWRSANGDRIGPLVQALVGTNDPKWLRYGCHYYSPLLGTWLRKVIHQESLPWEKKYSLVARVWEGVYEDAPRQLNWLSLQAFERELLLDILPGSRLKPRVLKSTDTLVCAQFPLNLARNIARSYQTSAAEDLHRDNVLRDKRASGISAVDWGSLRRFCTRLSRELDLKFWKLAAQPSALVRSFCYTLLPVLFDLLDRTQHERVVYIVVPWKTRRAHGRNRRPEEYGNFALVLGCGHIRRKLDCSKAPELCRVIESTSREAVCLDIASVERQEIRITGLEGDPDLEQVIRGLSTATWLNLKLLDAFKHYRRHIADQTQYDGGEDAVPLWGRSPHLERIVERVVDFSQDWKTKWRKRWDHSGVEALFLFSPPGCGKEGLWLLLCSYACTAGRRLSLKGLRRQDRLVRLYVSQHKDSPLPFPETVVAGHEVSKPAAALLLFGSGSPKGRTVGRLARFNRLRHPLFIDEFNTMDKETANVFLRVLEKPHKAHDEGLSRTEQLSLPILFASNRNREQLREAGFNDAVLTRLMSGKNYLEIDPLSKRRPDALISFVWGLLRKWHFRKGVEKEKREIRIDPAALRLVAYANWDEGNYRDLGRFGDLVVENEKRRTPDPEVATLTVDEAMRYLQMFGKLK